MKGMTGLAKSNSPGQESKNYLTFERKCDIICYRFEKKKDNEIGKMKFS